MKLVSFVANKLVLITFEINGDPLSPTFACAVCVCIQAVASIDHVPFSISNYNADEQFPLTKRDRLHGNQRAEHFSRVKSADNEKIKFPRRSAP